MPGRPLRSIHGPQARRGFQRIHAVRLAASCRAPRWFWRAGSRLPRTGRGRWARTAVRHAGCVDLADLGELKCAMRARCRIRVSSGTWQPRGHPAKVNPDRAAMVPIAREPRQASGRGAPLGSPRGDSAQVHAMRPNSFKRVGVCTRGGARAPPFLLTRRKPVVFAQHPNRDTYPCGTLAANGPRRPATRFAGRQAPGRSPGRPKGS